jgi:hypothetical protein
LGKRDDEPSSYDDESESYFPDNLNLENWENGANMENKNDIDIDYDFLNYRPGKFRLIRALLWTIENYIKVNFFPPNFSFVF